MAACLLAWASCALLRPWRCLSSPSIHRPRGGKEFAKMIVMGSDFDYKNPEFTSQAIGNRAKRYTRFTPIMKWEFQRDMIRTMTRIRLMKHVVDNKPPKRPLVVQWNKNRQEVEDNRLKMIAKENHAMLERLQKIHDRPRSSFCHMKRRGEPLVTGDGYRVPPPTGKGLYLVDMYKKLKLANPVAARKSIRVQQEMLTSAIDLVQKSNKSKTMEEQIEELVEITLAAADDAPILVEPKEEPLSPIELVQRTRPNIDAELLEILVDDFGPTEAAHLPELDLDGKPFDTDNSGNPSVSTTEIQSETTESPTETPSGHEHDTSSMENPNSEASSRTAKESAY